MYKNANTLPYICLFFLLTFPNLTIAKSSIVSESVITLPIEADLKVLEKYLNNMIPQLLAEIDEPNRVCSKAQYLKTKGLPKCHIDGYEVACKTQKIKIKIFPEIYCKIKGWVKRNGPISLSGQGKTLTFAFPIKAQVSSEAGISETARASAVLYIDTTVNIDKNWSVSLDVVPHFIWSKEPSIKVLNIIDFNLKNKVEPKLQKKIDHFVKKIPKLLAKLGIKEKIHKVWKDIQEPIIIDKKSNTYLIFSPTSASYSGFEIVDNILKMTISTKGSTEIRLGNLDSNCKKTALCNLGTIAHKKGEFNFNIPVLLSYKELLVLSNNKFSEVYTIDMHKSTLPGILKISNPRINKSHDGHLSISAHIVYDHRSSWLKSIDIFDWFNVNGEITFKGTPRIDKTSRSLVLDNLVYDSSTNSELFDMLIDAAKLQTIKSHFSDLIKYEFGKKIDDKITKVNLALKQLSKGSIKMSAFLEIASIEDIILHEEHITINAKLSGIVKANVGL